MPIDSALTKYGAYRPAVCTSTTRPTSPYVGQMVYETDTYSVRIWDGTAWVGTTPAGAIETYAGSTAPNGWLLCFGQAVSRTTYADLFAALSTTHGVGDGSTTFNLPDLRGRVPAGKDNMGGTAASRLTTSVTGGTLGAVGGHQHLQTHTHTQDAHAHNIIVEGLASYRQQATGGSLYGFGYASGGDSIRSDWLRPITAGGVAATNQNTGSGDSQNVQPTIILNYIIKV